MITGFVRRAKRNAGVTRGPHKLAVRRHCFDVLYRVAQRYVYDVSSLQRHHYAAFSPRERAHRARAEVRRQHPIESVWTSAALQMTEHDATRFSTGHVLDFVL